MSGAIFVNDGGTWKSVNFNAAAALWVKHSGTWKEPTAVYVKHSGTWKKVYPSDSESWTASNLGTQVGSTSSSQAPDFVGVSGDLLVTDATYVWRSDVDESLGEGDTKTVWDFGWAPTSSVGFSYGAVTRVELTAQVRRDQTGASAAQGIRVVPLQGGTSTSMKTTSSSFTLFTSDKTVASWGLTDAEAGALHLAPSSTNAMKIWGNLELPSTFEILAGATDPKTQVKNYKARIKYLHN